MEPPYGTDESATTVWTLMKSLYGLKQAGHNWMKEMFAFLKDFGFKQSLSDTSLWQLNDDNGDVDMILFIHTDDGKVGYKDEARYNNFLDALKSKFKIGFAKIGIDRIFNIKVEHRRQMIRLSQQKYIQDLLTQYNVVEDPKVTAPMSTSYQLVQRTDQLSEKEITSTIHIYVV